MPGSLVPDARALEVYTFESLTADAFLDGQDGWKDQPGDGQAVVAIDVTGNGTKVVRHHKTATTQETAFLTRTNDAWFNFEPFSGAETNAIVQFETTGEYVSLFALGRDRNGDGLLTAAESEIGPAFGVFDRKFRIQEANLGVVHEDNFNEDGGDANSGNDWYRIQFRMNFTTNGGVASLYFMNLSDGDTSFHTVSGMRNQPLGLGSLPPDAGPARWNALWLQVLSNGNSVPTVDNLIPNANSIRITNIVCVGTDVVLSWNGGSGPYQLQRQSVLGTNAWDNVGGLTTLRTAAAPEGDAPAFLRVLDP